MRLRRSGQGVNRDIVAAENLNRLQRAGCCQNSHSCLNVHPAGDYTQTEMGQVGRETVETSRRRIPAPLMCRTASDDSTYTSVIWRFLRMKEVGEGCQLVS